MRYKCIVSYDGTAYAGWQRQNGKRSIQQTIEEALKKIVCQDIKIYASGRTDAQVHARGQVFHFDCDKKFADFRKALNSQLPKDIYILSMEPVADDFHSRFSACYKHYDYLINDGDYDPLMVNYCCQTNRKLDIALMEKFSKIFIGEHDFTSFNATKKAEVENQVRTIYRIDVKRHGNMIKISYYGNGFLRYMVRILSQCLIEAALGNLTEKQLTEMLEAEDKRACHYNGQPQGLYLMEVSYKPYLVAPVAEW
ncbi:MAG: tRNA pseudouridine(38-40) synthase TruA [Erysipelotrichia bacterium]|nr:tRNA pseudouridine(38-40) synthase TruA [Erysipelotrichia bacterium]